MNDLKKETGITLIALIITIIVLLILAGVSIALVVGDNGVLSNAVKAVEQTGLAGAQEAAELAIVTAQTEYYTAKANGETDKTQTEYITMKMIRNNLSNDYTYCSATSTEENTNDDEKTLSELDKSFYISKDNNIYTIIYIINDNGEISDIKVVLGIYDNIIDYNSYIGYYADVDGDGTVDGIIFADLAIGGSVTYDVLYTTYSTSYSAISISNLKEYCISQETYTDTYFGENYVITPISKMSGEDRFYVMELSTHTYNSNSTATYATYATSFCWYASADTDYSDTAISDWKSLTSTEFGTGITNTLTMKELWESETYGLKNYEENFDDIWSIDAIGTNVGNTDSIWFVPSAMELAVFVR